jgi:hypothetical protein
MMNEEPFVSLLEVLTEALDVFGKYVNFNVLTFFGNQETQNEHCRVT